MYTHPAVDFFSICQMSNWFVCLLSSFFQVAYKNPVTQAFTSRQKTQHSTFSPYIHYVIFFCLYFILFSPNIIQYWPFLHTPPSPLPLYCICTYILSSSHLPMLLLRIHQFFTEDVLKCYVVIHKDTNREVLLHC